MILLYCSLGFLLIAALMGVYLLTSVLQKIETRKGIALLHGSFAALALILLICFALQNPEFESVPAIAVLVATALGGFFLIARDLIGYNPPRWLALLHGILAITGFGLALRMLTQ